MNNNPISNPFDEDEKSGGQPIVWAMLGVAAMCLGVLAAGAIFWLKPDAQSLIGQYFPSPTATPTATRTLTPMPTFTPTHTSTPTPNLTATLEIQNALSTAESAATNWKVTFSDTFDSNKNNWLVEESEDEYAITNYEIVDGKYRWDSTAHKSFIGWVRADRKALTDFYLSVDIQQVEGPNTADYGVIFREDDNSNFYYFGISDNGQYVLYLFFEEWDTLINWTETDLIKPGEINRLTVIGEGSHFTFFINDRYLTEIMDDTISSGSTALVIEMADEDDHAIFEFDNFELRAP